LDDELQCMALIRALPDEYRHLSSNLLLADKLDKGVILQAFRSEELNRQRNAGAGESLNKVQVQGYKGKKRPLAEILCYLCKKLGHTQYYCPLLKQKLEEVKNAGKSFEGAKKAEEEKAAAVTEFAGQASAVDDLAMSTSSNIFHWNTDTGATSHMSPHKSWFRNYTPYKVPIRLADSRVIYSEGVGSVLFRPLINGQLSRDVEFARVLHVPALRNNLLAVLYLTKRKSLNVHISGDHMEFERDGSVLFTATINNDNVGYLNGHTVDINESVQLVSTLPLDLSLWHKRLGHHNYDGIKLMIHDNLVDGLVLDSKNSPDPICEPCLAGKMHANPFHSSNSRATELLELVHSDVYDASHISHGGYRYWALFIDDCSRQKFAIPMKRKSETFAAFKTFKAYAEKHTGKLLKCLREDKGGEYMSNEFDTFLKECGIIREHSVRNRPQQNGVAERANRTLGERITAMLSESGLSKAYWAECLAALVHVLNRCPTSGATPYECWHGKKPGVSHLRVWGCLACLAYVHIQRDKRSKFDSHMEKCVFVGYPDGYKGWKFYNPETRKVIISERADFDERYTYDGKLLREGVENTNPELRPLVPIDHESSSVVPPEVVENPIENVEEEFDEKKEDQPVVEENADPQPVSVEQHQEEEEEVNDDDRPIALRRARREIRLPWKLRDPPPIIMSDSEESTDESDEEGVHVVVQGENEPQSFTEAMQLPLADKWKDACLEEYNWHLENSTWTLVELPPGQKAIGSKWVFKIKHNADGSIERFKARLVAKGFSQRPGQDYFETFASTMRATTIRTVLALAAIEDLELRSVDISHAFTNSDIDAEIYMAQPEGFKQGGSKYVCRLNKSLYGLKQSPRLWGEKLAEVLSQMGFVKTYSDAALFIYDRDGIKVIVPVFVDDITFASKSVEILDSFVVEMSKYFKLRDLGKTSLLLGISIMRDRPNRKLWLSQKQYIMNKLEEFKMADCKPVGTPILPGHNLSSTQCPNTPEEKAEMDGIPYINAVGSLMYLAIMTRPDIAFAVGVLARFNSNPGKVHWNAVKHVFRYLKGTVDLKLEYGPGEKLEGERFLTYSDADYGGDVDRRKSTDGYMIKVGSGTVCWSSKLQQVVTLSTTEAEYLAAVRASKEICWMQQMLKEIGFMSSAPSTLFVDNQSAISVAKNPEHHGRMKHLDLAYYWLRDKVAERKIQVVHLPSSDMPADLLTKALPKPQVAKLRKLMGLVG